MFFGMNVDNTLIEAQKIASQIQEMIPQSTYKNMQSAIANICVPEVKFNTALTEYVKSFQPITPPAIVYSIVPDMVKTMITPVLEQIEEINRMTFCFRLL